MADEFLMPKLGLTMEAGTIIRWLVDAGTEVAAGQPILVIETDKVESEVLATGGGRLDPVGIVGEEYPCGARIGWLLAEGETPPPRSAPADAPVSVPVAAAPSVPAASLPAALPSAGVGGRLLASPNARRVAAERGVDLAAVPGSGPGGRITSEDVCAAAPSVGVGGRVLASPNARRVAAERGVDLASVPGSGPGGRITSEDVEAAPLPAPPAPVAPAPTSAGVPPGPAAIGRLATAAARNLADLLGVDLATVTPAGVDPRVTREDVAAHVRALLASLGPDLPPAAPASTEAPPPVTTAAEVVLPQEPSATIPLRGMRGTIARRMTESLHSMAQLTLTMDVGMDAVVADRDRRREAGGVVPGYTDYVIAATAAAIGEHPVVNSMVTSDGVAILPRIDIGMAVALDDGLIVPVIRDTPSLTLAALAAETSRLAEAARTGSLTLPDLEGSTFSVTALGMFGVDGFTPIVNAPNTAILGVGRIRDDVAWSGDVLSRARRLTLSLTWDHRAFDGAPAARFVQSIKAVLEAPDALR